MRDGARRALPRFVGALILLGLWELLARSRWAGRTLLASPEEVLAALSRALRPGAPGSHGVFAHAWATLGRALPGWALSLAAGVPLGVAVGALRGWRLGADALVGFVRAIPPILVFPLLLVAFDYGDGAYVSTVAFGCAPVVVVTVARAVEGGSRERFELLDVFGAGRAVRALTWAMELIPAVVLGARLALALAVVIAVVTEMVFTPRAGVALGSLAKDAQMSFDTPVLYASMVVIGAFGYASDRALRALERRLGVDDTRGP